MLLWITESANWYALFVHFSNTKLAVSVYGSIKTRGNVLPVETCSAQICGFHIDHIAGSFSLIFALVINIPFVWCLVYALGVGVRFQNPLEAISSFITISHFLPLPLVTHAEFSPVWPQGSYETTAHNLQLTQDRCRTPNCPLSFVGKKTWNI